MLREITLGQYYPVDSPVHRLDPRTKLFGTMVYYFIIYSGEFLGLSAGDACAGLCDPPDEGSLRFYGPGVKGGFSAAANQRQL